MRERERGEYIVVLVYQARPSLPVRAINTHSNYTLVGREV